MKLLYGLAVRSEVPLSGLPEANVEEPDINIRIGNIREENEEIRGPENTIKSTPSGIYFYWKSIGAFLVKNSEVVIVDPSPGVDDCLLQLPIFGPVMATVLSGRRFLVLHASAVEREGKAIAFLGPKGTGKSTTAAAMCMNGYQLVTDDMLVLDMYQDSQPVAAPGPFMLKVREDTAGLLSIDHAKIFKPDHPRFRKKIYSPDADSPGRSFPIETMYFLDIGTEISLTTLHGKEKLIHIISSVYGTGSLDRVLSREKGDRLRKCKALANSVRSKKITRLDDVEAINDLASRILKD